MGQEAMASTWRQRGRRHPACGAGPAPLAPGGARAAAGAGRSGQRPRTFCRGASRALRARPALLRAALTCPAPEKQACGGAAVQGGVRHDMGAGVRQPGHAVQWTHGGRWGRGVVAPGAGTQRQGATAGSSSGHSADAFVAAAAPHGAAPGTARVRALLAAPSRRVAGEAVGAAAPCSLLGGGGGACREVPRARLTCMCPLVSPPAAGARRAPSCVSLSQPSIACSDADSSERITAGNWGRS